MESPSDYLIGKMDRMIFESCFPKTKPVAKFTDNIDIQPCENGFVVTVGSSIERCVRGKRYVARGSDGLSSLIYNIVEGTA